MYKYELKWHLNCCEACYNYYKIHAKSFAATAITTEPAKTTIYNYKRGGPTPIQVDDFVLSWARVL
ncbi:hypothetical protein M5D96_006636 [Drosophila gunungcola]|uniref:Uncharacterized protein n=1 Tax=Drosophila gunungcola TaxID=103775 RepID=A0A9P9YPV3_9MUSC|nr:hypothetical protein M5D96_006636 [Drosophila gunungcola]